MLRLIRSVPVEPSVQFEAVLSAGAVILSVGHVISQDPLPEHPQIVFWCSVDPQEERVEIRVFEAIFNNQEYETKSRRYIDSVRLDGGRNVMHIFEKTVLAAPEKIILKSEESNSETGIQDNLRLSQEVGSYPPGEPLGLEGQQGDSKLPD